MLRVRLWVGLKVIWFLNDGLFLRSWLNKVSLLYESMIVWVKQITLEINHTVLTKLHTYEEPYDHTVWSYPLNDDLSLPPADYRIKLVTDRMLCSGYSLCWVKCWWRRWNWCTQIVIVWTLLENHEDNVRLRLLVKSIIKIMNLDERWATTWPLKTKLWQQSIPERLL